MAVWEEASFRKNEFENGSMQREKKLPIFLNASLWKRQLGNNLACCWLFQSKTFPIRWPRTAHSLCFPVDINKWNHNLLFCYSEENRNTPTTGKVIGTILAVVHYIFPLYFSNLFYKITKNWDLRNVGWDIGANNFTFYFDHYILKVKVFPSPL